MIGWVVLRSQPIWPARQFRPSASITSGTGEDAISHSVSARVAAVTPMPGPKTMAFLPSNSRSRRVVSSVENAQLPSSPGSGSVISSGVRARIAPKSGAGQPMVVRPAPARSAAPRVCG